MTNFDKAKKKEHYLCMSIDKELLTGFIAESNGLIAYMTEILEACETDFRLVKRLEDYGQNVDRIMGGAQSLAMMEPDTEHLIHRIGNYSALCKAVGYKTSQITNNQNFYEICVALLLDATEILEEMIQELEKSPDGKGNSMKEMVSQTLIDRVRWVSSQFSEEYRASVAVTSKDSNKMSQNQIDDLLKKLGLDD